MGTGQEFDGLLEKLSERTSLPATMTAVMLVGSAARGWHNVKSDYDIYVFSRELELVEGRETFSLPLNPAVVQTEVAYVDGRRWEIKFWVDSQVDQMLAKVSWSEFELGRTAGDVLKLREEMLLARLAKCVPLAGDAWIQERREQLKASAFQSILVAASLGAADSAVEDALGQVESHDLESAVLSARRALGHAVDALLTQQGEYDRSIKWRPQRFRAADPPVLGFDTYWALETMRTYDPADPAKWVREVLAVCQEISMKVTV